MPTDNKKPTTSRTTYWIEINVAARDATPVWRDMIGMFGQRLRWGSEEIARTAFIRETPKELRLMESRGGLLRQVLPAPLLDAVGAPE